MKKKEVDTRQICKTCHSFSSTGKSMGWCMKNREGMKQTGYCGKWN